MPDQTDADHIDTGLRSAADKAKQSVDAMIDDWESIEDTEGIGYSRAEPMQLTVDEAIEVLKALDDRDPSSTKQSAKAKVRDSLPDKL